MLKELAGADIKEMKDKECTFFCVSPSDKSRTRDRFRRIQEQILGKLDPYEHNPQANHRRCERIRCMALDSFSR